MRSHRRIGARMLVILIGLTAGVVATYHVTLTVLERTLTAEREVMLENLAETAHGVAAQYLEQTFIGAMTEADAQAAALEVIRAMRYDGNYFWVQDESGVMLMHPNRDVEGQDLSGLADADGVQPIAEVAEVGRDGGSGFVHFRWPRAGSREPLPKLHFAQSFAEWDWVISTGVYIDDIDPAARAMAARLSAVVLAVLAAISGLTAVVTWHRPVTSESYRTHTAVDRG